MKKEDFTELLTDLYLAYNPDFIKYVEQLVTKYHRMEFDAVQNVLIKYSVYAFEGTIRMSYLDDGHAFIMANTLLMFVEDLRNTSTVLKINVPDQWKKITTSLTQLEGKSNAFYVPNYDILVDSPIEIGNHDILEFTAANVPHQVVLYGASQYKAERIKKDLTKIIEEATDIFDENPNRISIGEVQIGVNYVIILNTNAGLWGYNIGDTIEFISLKPHRIIVTGRIKHFISAFGEHVIGKEVEQAMQDATDAKSGSVTEFTIAPKINVENGLPYHEWFVEFEEEPEDLEQFSKIIDDSLQSQNSYYYDLIVGKVLQPLKITKIQSGGFHAYMKSIGKLGGQNKIPRLSNDRKIADQLKPFEA